MLRRDMRQRALVALAVVALALPAWVCAGVATAARAPHHWKVLVGAQTHRGAIQTMSFYPAHLWVDQGDSVTWVANSAEIHTVTFLSSEQPCPDGSLCSLPPGFNPGDPVQSTPQGSSTYDGQSYYNSGVLTTAKDGAMPLPPFVHVRHSYTLTFPDSLAPGTYAYYCLVHGAMMKGQIVVQAAGTSYPLTLRQYNRRARSKTAADYADGMRLWRAARHQAAARTRKNGPTILAGMMDTHAMVMRFVPRTVTAHVGRRVHFVATSMGEPHIVTFGDDVTGCGSPPCDPSQPWNIVMTSDGNERASFPGRNGDYTGSPADLNSGVMLGAPPSMTGAPQQLTLKLTKEGTYHYSCALHDYMGMLGVLNVVRAASRSGR